MSLDELQGNVLCGYRSEYARYVFARVSDADAGRRWLAGRIDQVTFNPSWGGDSPDHTLNLGFTAAGLLALGVPADRLGGLQAFTSGMAARAELLGDVGPCGPEFWEPGLRQTHVLVTLTAWDAERLARPHSELLGAIEDGSAGLTLALDQPTAKLPGAREHFGFSDGFSQPSVDGANTGPRDGEGTRTPWGRWRDLALGEFILGRRDEGGLDAPGPAGVLGRDATFMVVRKLEQDVVAFRAYVAEQGRRCDRDPDWIAARMVGRWQNGSALARHPGGPGPPAADGPGRTNRFSYAADRDGTACPLGAHVRRANPRDGLGWGGRLTQRHRMLRRGMAYGGALPEEPSEEEAAAERGLMFVSYQASIERQFEFVQRQWLGDGNVFGLGDDRDPIVAGVGAGSSAQMVVQGPKPLFLSELPRFVTTRGGDYFLVPGRAGLQAIAAGKC